MNKKIVVVIISCAIILIILGCIVAFMNNNSNTDNNGISNVSTNKSENLQTSHCLNDLCVASMNITYNKGEGKIEFVLQNTSSLPVEGNYLKLVFDNNQDLSYIYRYDAMEPSASTNIVIEFAEKELIDVKDYQITELTTRELNEFKNGEDGTTVEETGNSGIIESDPNKEQEIIGEDHGEE